MLKLLLIRHAPALPREEAVATGLLDPERPLTPKGRKRMARSAAAIHRLVPSLAAIATSPLLRSVESAAILAAEFGCAPPIETEALAPGTSPENLVRWLREWQELKSIALIGHEPDLGIWTGWAVTGQEQQLFTYKKAGAALLLFNGEAAPGQGRLQWLLTPAQLRALD